ncbi:MFS transporter [Prauserella endophytica]|uniref:MHS family MFS transporter n=1 Tax=Prauserella endophytica TaxID=1592324 RepID=A0ABY2S5Y2_9PSEU|nr:MFS transporter [Prauserella endophytica]TKG71076.1 MHS family MFS transporter [Prauserella endophytica]
MDTQRTTAPPRVHPAKVAFASFIGTAIEWYDFFLFGTAATLVFNEQFFPTLSPAAGTLAAFATFGVAFLARPLGGVVLGHFGDRLGRKRMLVLSLMLMGAATVAIGLLPTYAQIGLAAPALLVVCRFVQGIAVGGEWGGAVLMAVEHAPPRRRAFYGSWPQAGVPAGLVLSASAFFAIEQLPDEQVTAWAWRLPFLASILLVLLGLYVRLQVIESPDFERVRQSRSAFPLGEVLRTSRKSLLIGLCTQAAANIPFYIVTVFVLSYGPSELGVSRDTILLCLMAACVLDIGSVPLVATFADRVGRRTVLLAGAVYMAAIAFPFFWLFDTASPWLILVGMILVVTVGHAVTYAAIAGFLAELFPARVRYTGASVAYQAGGMVTSGPAPFVAGALFGVAGGSWVLAVYIVVACAVTFGALLAADRDSGSDR